MQNEHSYRMALRWEGDPTTGTASYASYDRRYRIHIDGKPDLVGSADPVFRGDRALHNPEELFVAALASCHMLAYLALCARNGVNVVTYADEAHGRMITRPGGGGAFEQVVLRPVVQIAAGSDVTRAIELHARAHELCFIASSCSVPIECRPTVSVARESARAAG